MLQLLKKKYVRAALAVGLLCAFCATFEVAVVPTPSMESTVLVGDHLLVNRLAFRWKRVERGEVISFRSPRNAREVFLKRVIALGGDRVEFRGASVYVNGAPLNESYARHDCRVCTERQMTIVVPDGQLFVLGDNRDQSLDSRYWGFVPRENVIGRPLIIYWSFRRPEGGDGPYADDTLSRFAYVLTHLFQFTRWDRTFRIVR